MVFGMVGIPGWNSQSLALGIVFGVIAGILTRFGMFSGWEKHQSQITYSELRARYSEISETERLAHDIKCRTLHETGKTFT